jgi:hypothetical protein
MCGSSSGSAVAEPVAAHRGEHLESRTDAPLVGEPVRPLALETGDRLVWHAREESIGGRLANGARPM